MKKIRELLKNRKWRWTAGGVACLVAAAMLFALSSGIGVRAVQLGDTTLELEVDNTGAYLIKDSSQLKTLGNASSGTAGNTFKLSNDLNVSVTSPATGTFAGTFDGNGHVITYSESSMTVTDDTAVNDSKVQGLLFGKVTGTVQNLIIDVQGVNYTRNSKTKVQGTLGEEILYTPNPEITGPVGGVDATGASLNNAVTLRELAESKDTDKPTVTKREAASVKKTYAAAPGTDYFGLICGENIGTIQQVYVTGNDVTITRNELEALGYTTARVGGTADISYVYQEAVDTKEIESTLTVGSGNSIKDDKTNLEAVLTHADETQDVTSGEGTGATTAVKTKRTYTLTLENTNALESVIDISKNITVQMGDDWKDTQGNAAGTITLEAGNSISLTKIVESEETLNLESVTVSHKLVQQAYQYTYKDETSASNFSASDPLTETPADAEKIFAGNHLYAGGFVGNNSGTISEVKQNVDLKGTEVDDEFSIGGIAGIADGELSDIYLLGKVNNSSKYVGEGLDSEPDNSATSEPGSVLSDKWSSYDKYDADGSSETNYDLAWLIQKDNAFDYEDPASDGAEGSNVQVTAAAPKTDKALNYEIVYQARKNITQTIEDTIYKTETENTGKIELGHSGFYGLYSAYATDGYYHYYDSAVDSAGNVALVYPYDDFTNENPYKVTKSEVVRSTSPVLDDSVRITFANTVTGKVYYNAYEADSSLDAVPNKGQNSTTAEIEINSDQFLLPFKTSSIKYHVVPVIVENGHNVIYPAQLTVPSFEQGNKQPLPRPEVTGFDYYDANGEFRPYKPFSATNIYVDGTEMIIKPRFAAENDETYTISYLYSTEKPGEMGSGEWDTTNEKEEYQYRYEGTDASFMDQATAYSGLAVIPKDLIGDDTDQTVETYLYIKIAAKNYDPQIYYYGAFKVKEKDQLSAASTSNTDSIVNGDIVTVTGANSFQWIVSNEPKVSFNGINWNEETDGSAEITMNSNNGNYVYARIKYIDGEQTYYSEVFEFEYTFGGVCADPRVTPNTGVSSGIADEDEIAAATISASTAISISSNTENANIFYQKSDSLNPISMTRVLNVPEGIVNDGDSNETDIYFKVGNSWYKTAKAQNEEERVQRYTAGNSVFLNNETKETKLKHLSVIAIADGYENSAVLNYIYKVQPAQQTAIPEAAIETYHTPGGIDIARTSVELGKTISFYSVTPEATLHLVDQATGTVDDTAILNNTITVTGDYGGTFAVTLLARKTGMLDSDAITFVYDIAEQEKAAVPTATPGTTSDVPTTVIPGNKILLSTTTKEAKIFYTTDGTSPKVKEENGTFDSASTSTLKYDPSEGIVMPLDGSGYFSITAITVKAGLAQSDEAYFIYNYPDAVLKPYATVDPGKVELNTQVVLKNLTDGATIYYTVAYGDTLPAEPTLSSSVFSEEYPFTITQKTTIKAMAAKDGVKSEIVEFVYDPMAKLEAPTASIASGSVVARGSILSLHAAKGATIYYTMDGSDPADSANTAVIVGNSLILNGEAGGQITVKAFAKAADRSQSEVVTFTYQFSQNAGGVTASIESGTEVSNGTKVNLISDVTDGDIYYTTNGSSPVDHGKKGTTVEINGTPGSSVTVKAVVIVDDEPGIIATFIYKIKEKPTAPTASPSGGTLTVATRVTLNSSAEKIYYTTDGTTPTKSSALYSEPILINRTTTLQAIGVSEDGEISDVAVFTYTAAEKAASVRASEADGAILEPGTKVQLTTSTQGAQIYYSTDGTEPTVNNLDHLLLYDGEAIEIHRSVVIQAAAYRSDLRLSNVSSWSYIVDTIPAVVQKEAEAAKLAEEGLKDTDATELSRKTDEPEELMRTVREKEYKTSISYPEGAFAKTIVLETSKEDTNPYALKKTKGIYGDDTTILGTYKMKAKEGSYGVQPKEEVEISFKIPKGYEDATLSVAYVQDDYNLTTLETRREADVLYAKTEKLGSYVIIGPERAAEEHKSFPYIVILECAAGAALVGGIGFYIGEKIKNSRKKR